MGQPRFGFKLKMSAMLHPYSGVALEDKYEGRPSSQAEGEVQHPITHFVGKEEPNSWAVGNGLG